MISRLKVFTVVEDANEIARAQSKFVERVSRAATKHCPLTLGYQGGGLESMAFHLGPLGIWVAMEDADNRYWNALGIGNPFTGDHTIVVEINPPKSGIDRRISGAFVKDVSGSVHLAHRGRVGGGRKGIGKQAFLEWYPGSTAEVRDGKMISDMIVIAALHDPRLLEELAVFIRQVAQFKDWAVGRKQA